MAGIAVLALILYHVITVCMAQYLHGFETGGCSSADFPADIDGSETVVKITKCPMQGIPAGALDHLVALEEFYMTDMPTLQTFPNVTAVGSTLITIGLWANAISYINPDFLKALVVLKNLNIVDNMIDFIPDVPSLASVRGLYSTSNAFTKIPQVSYWQDLRHLQLASNKIAAISKDDFKEMATVADVFLENNLLEELPDFVHLSQLKKLLLNGNPLKLLPPHNTAVLSQLEELSLLDTTQLHVVPTLCSKQPEVLSIDVSGSGVRLCDCQHAWLKLAVEEKGSTVTMRPEDEAAAVCEGQAWNSITTAQFMNICQQRNYHREVQVTVTKRSSPLYCSFPRQPVQNNISINDCILQCISTKGCLSVNFKPAAGGGRGGAVESGDCVLLAPSDDGSSHEDAAAAAEDGWMLYGLTM